MDFMGIYTLKELCFDGALNSANVQIYANGRTTKHKGKDVCKEHGGTAGVAA
jgi:hypothetical protein